MANRRDGTPSNRNRDISEPVNGRRRSDLQTISTTRGNSNKRSRGTSGKSTKASRTSGVRRPIDNTTQGTASRKSQSKKSSYSGAYKSEDEADRRRALQSKDARRKQSRAGNSKGKVSRADDSIRRNKRTRQKRGFAAWSMGRKIATIASVFLIGLVLSGVAYAANLYSKIHTTTLNAEKLDMSISDEAQLSGEGYLNVAIFGVDSREGTNEELDGVERSDTIMIASLDQKTGAVKITSVYRDTLLEMEDGVSYDKVNAAYAYGGAQEAVTVLNKNLDMDIQHYVTVNFSALIDVIDALGGVELTLTDEEVTWTNEYQKETSKITGTEIKNVEQPGTQVLNGRQATAYCRIRYTDGDDYRRTERQREVLTQIANKATKANILALNKLVDAVFPMIETNFTLTEALSYVGLASKITVGETCGFPFDKTTGIIGDAGDSVIATSLSSNVIQLHQFFFGTDGYTPSSTVTTISGNIDYQAANVGIDMTGSGLAQDTSGGYGTTTDGAAGQTYTDQTYTDQTYTDQTYTDQTYTDQTYTDQTNTDQTYIDQSGANQTTDGTY